MSTLDSVRKLQSRMGQSIIGQESVIEQLIIGLLANGNIVIGCFHAYKKGKGVGLIEITRDKKMVWCLVAPKLATSMMSVQKLTADGKCRTGKTLR